jgi:hypothetical protein
LWHEAKDGWKINDFAEYNVTREMAEAKRAAKSEAGKRGAAARWGDGKPMADAMAGAMASAGSCHDPGMANDAPDPTRPLVSSKDDTSPAKETAKQRERDKATDDDRRLCRTLAEHIRSRNPKAKIGSDTEWLRSMRLLRDRDKQTPDEIDRLIRWTFTDTSKDAQFWAKTIESPASLREHFARMWGQMVATPLAAVPSVEDSSAYLARRGAA